MIKEENITTGNRADYRAIILAAGQGKRLHSAEINQPKVLRQVNGRSLLDYVLTATSFIASADTMLVVGYMWQQVCQAVGDIYPYVIQAEQLGTGHAVMQAREWLAADDRPVLCCYGDMPLVQATTYQKLLQEHSGSGADCTILVYTTELDLAYGRIIKDQQGQFVTIVEDRDCGPVERQIHDYNAGVYVFNPQSLLDGLANLKNDNKQREYYLTDVPHFIKQQGGKIHLVASADKYEGLGVNTQVDLDLIGQIIARK